MLRILGTAVRGTISRTNVAELARSTISKPYTLVQNAQQRCFGALTTAVRNSNNFGINENKSILGQTQIENAIPRMTTPIITPSRNVTKFSLLKGKRKTVKAVVHRFYRLNWGIWIRTYAGRFKHLWRKSERRKHRLRQHVFTNATQSTMLDKMVTKYWKRPRFYVDDPYAPYHKREEFLYTRKKPLP